MKKFSFILFAACALALAVYAGSPAYKSGTVNPSSGEANLVFAADPALQIRVVSIIATSDTNTSTLQIFGGTSAHSTTNGLTNVWNTGGASNIVVTSVAPLTNNDVVIIETLTSNFVSKIASVSGASNMITLTNGPGFTNAGIVNVYRMADYTQALVLGQKTNQIYSSDALYVAPSQGRPVLIRVGTAGSNRVDGATVRYE